MKVLAVDYGSKRVGLAVGDSLTRIASPLALVASTRQQAVLEAILERTREFEVERIVVGYPLNMDGSRGPACAAVDRFVAFLRKRVGVPVVLFDETLSSFAAEERGKEIEHDFRRRRKFLDSMAAQVILESFFAKEVKPGQ
jgi:putative Holliday junction resolvase